MEPALNFNWATWDAERGREGGFGSRGIGDHDQPMPRARLELMSHLFADHGLRSELNAPLAREELERAHQQLHAHNPEGVFASHHIHHVETEAPKSSRAGDSLGAVPASILPGPRVEPESPHHDIADGKPGRGFMPAVAHQPSKNAEEFHPSRIRLARARVDETVQRIAAMSEQSYRSAWAEPQTVAVGVDGEGKADNIMPRAVGADDLRSHLLSKHHKHDDIEGLSPGELATTHGAIHESKQKLLDHRHWGGAGGQ